MIKKSSVGGHLSRQGLSLEGPPHACAGRPARANRRCARPAGRARRPPRRVASSGHAPNPPHTKRLRGPASSVLRLHLLELLLDLECPAALGKVCAAGGRAGGCGGARGGGAGARGVERASGALSFEGRCHTRARLGGAQTSGTRQRAPPARRERCAEGGRPAAAACCCRRRGTTERPPARRGRRRRKSAARGCCCCPLPSARHDPAHGARSVGVATGVARVRHRRRRHATHCPSGCSPRWCTPGRSTWRLQRASAGRRNWAGGRIVARARRPRATHRPSRRGRARERAAAGAAHRSQPRLPASGRRGGARGA